MTPQSPHPLQIAENSPRLSPFQRARADLYRSPWQFSLRTLLIAMAGLAVVAGLARLYHPAAILQMTTCFLGLLLAAALVGGIYALLRVPALLIGGWAALGGVGITCLSAAALNAEFERYQYVLDRAEAPTTIHQAWNRVQPGDFWRPLAGWLLVDAVVASLGMAGGVGIALARRWSKQRRHKQRGEGVDDAAPRFARARGALRRGWSELRWKIVLTGLVALVLLPLKVRPDWMRAPEIVGGCGSYFALVVVLAALVWVGWFFRRPLMWACGLGMVTALAMVGEGYANVLTLRSQGASFYTQTFFISFAECLAIYSVVALAGVALGMLVHRLASRPPTRR